MRVLSHRYKDKLRSDLQNLFASSCLKVNEQVFNKNNENLTKTLEDINQSYGFSHSRSVVAFNASDYCNLCKLTYSSKDENVVITSKRHILYFPRMGCCYQTNLSDLVDLSHTAQANVYSFNYPGTIPGSSKELAKTPIDLANCAIEVINKITISKRKS